MFKMTIYLYSGVKSVSTSVNYHKAFSAENETVKKLKKLTIKICGPSQLTLEVKPVNLTSETLKKFLLGVTKDRHSRWNYFRICLWCVFEYFAK